MPSYVQELRSAVTDAASQLLNLSDEAASRRPEPGKWSIKEIIGHLVDSACNNHGRFVRIPQQDNMVMTGYAQADWVDIQKYQTAPWEELVGLWKFYNLHLANLMETMPEEIRMKPYHKHNLDKIAMRRIPSEKPTSLDYLMDDYVFHLKHHLKQIFDLIATS